MKYILAALEISEDTVKLVGDRAQADFISAAVNEAKRRHLGIVAAVRTRLANDNLSADAVKRYAPILKSLTDAKLFRFVNGEVKLNAVHDKAVWRGLVASIEPQWTAPKTPKSVRYGMNAGWTRASLPLTLSPPVRHPPLGRLDAAAAATRHGTTD
ncbi:MAG: hypothetical protein ACYTKD_29770 [Planctomycetota bacterium]